MMALAVTLEETEWQFLVRVYRSPPDAELLEAP